MDATVTLRIRDSDSYSTVPPRRPIYLVAKKSPSPPRPYGDLQNARITVASNYYVNVAIYIFINVLMVLLREHGCVGDERVELAVSGSFNRNLRVPLAK